MYETKSLKPEEILKEAKRQFDKRYLSEDDRIVVQKFVLNYMFGNPERASRAYSLTSDLGFDEVSETRMEAIARTVLHGQPIVLCLPED